MESWEERREERRKYENDVFYDVWRSGGNPDAIDYERVNDNLHDGRHHEDAANDELRSQLPRIPEPDPAEQ